MVAGLGCRVQYEEALYAAVPARLLEVVRMLPDRNESVMLVGHNPSLEEFTAMLCGQSPHYPTAALATIDLSIDTWDEVSPGCGTLAVFVTAAQLKPRTEPRRDRPRDRPLRSGSDHCRRAGVAPGPRFAVPVLGRQSTEAVGRSRNRRRLLPHPARHLTYECGRADERPQLAVDFGLGFVVAKAYSLPFAMQIAMSTSITA